MLLIIEDESTGETATYEHDSRELNSPQGFDLVRAVEMANEITGDPFGAAIRAIERSHLNWERVYRSPRKSDNVYGICISEARPHTVGRYCDGRLGGLQLWDFEERVKGLRDYERTGSWT